MSDRKVDNVSVWWNVDVYLECVAFIQTVKPFVTLCFEKYKSSCFFLSEAQAFPVDRFCFIYFFILWIDEK